MNERTELEKLTDNLLTFFPADWIYDRSDSPLNEKPLALAVKGVVAKIFRLGMDAGYAKAMQSDKEDSEPRYRVDNLTKGDLGLLKLGAAGLSNIAGPYITEKLESAEEINGD